MRDAEYTLDGLTEFLRASGIDHFSGREVCPVGKKAKGTGPALILAPRVLWQNILPTLRVLEEARSHFGKPIMILSGYRDPAYNRAIGGETASLHMSFNAIDSVVQGVDVRDFAHYLNTRPDAARLGIGLYVKSGFVHCDTRGRIGRPAPARWDYETDSRWWEPPRKPAA